MRIVVNTRNKHEIEEDKRILKCNYRSRSNYSIENFILEKRLVCDNSIISSQSTIHNMTNLKLYYNRQLTQIRSIIKESMGMQRKPVKLIAKLLPNIKYYICTTHRVSEDYYSGCNDKLAGTE